MMSVVGSIQKSEASLVPRRFEVKDVHVGQMLLRQKHHETHERPHQMREGRCRGEPDREHHVRNEIEKNAVVGEVAPQHVGKTGRFRAIAFFHYPDTSDAP